jgi:hypothetical protein
MNDLLIQAMSAKQRGDNTLAKQLCSQAILQNPRDEAAWMLMAEVVGDVNQQRNCLEKVVTINPDNAAARQELTRLNTAPLQPVVRGERNKPLDTPAEPPKQEKTPPFTPPFTWDNKPEQYLALGELTFPNLSEEEEKSQLPETPPTFDWANESEEPDKTIDKIFEAVSKPELASETPPQKEDNWLDDLRPSDDILETQGDIKKAGPKKAEDPWLQELVGSETAAADESRPLTKDDFSVSAEPELGLQAFATSDEPPANTDEPDSLLWDNPLARSDRLVILSSRSLIYAHPAESDIPHILGLFGEKRMVRDLLGEDAHMIKLESIERVTANPKGANMVIEYQQNGKLTTHQLFFSSPQVRDEALKALKFRLGAGFKQSSTTFSNEDKILSPIVILILLAAFTWGLIWGVPLLSKVPGFDSGSTQVTLSSIEQLVGQIGAFWIILIAVLIAAACVYWMVANLRKPASEVVLKR